MHNTDSRVTIHMVASLDGFIAREDGSVDWLETSDEFAGGDTLDRPDSSSCCSAAWPRPRCPTSMGSILGPLDGASSSFFVWTLFALGVSGSFTAILAVRALWRSVRLGRARTALHRLRHERVTVIGEAVRAAVQAHTYREPLTSGCA